MLSLKNEQREKRKKKGEGKDETTTDIITMER